MGLEVGNLLGAASSVMGGFSNESSLKKFISTMDSLGVQINSRYEAIFSAIPQTTFFIQSINMPSMKQNTTQLYFDGKVVEIPQNYEFDHDFNMTVINDASGVIYTALMNFVMGDSGSALTNSGYTITIRAIGDDNCGGSIIKLNGVRIKNISGLHFQHQGGEIQTFDVQASAIDFNVTPGALKEASGIVGAIGSLLA